MGEPRDRRGHRSRRAFIGGAVGALSTSLVVGCSSDCPVESPPPEEASAILAAPKTDGDLMPMLDRERLEDIRLDTVRSLGSAGDADYWVAVSEDDEICLITGFIEAESSITATSCSTLSRFFETGLAGGARGLAADGEVVSEAYLLPDDVNAEPLSEHVGEYLVPVEAPEGITAERATLQEEVNFFSLRPGARGVPPVELDRTCGGPFTFSTLM